MEQEEPANIGKKVFHKYPKIFLLGYEENKDIFSDSEDEIIVEEKIDGTNMRFMIKDKRIIFGSHTKELENQPEKFFCRSIEYIKNKLANKDLSKYNDFIFFGEGCIKHTIDYNWDKIPPFLGFDIWRFTENQFIDSATAILIYNQLGLDFVPILNIAFTAKECLELKMDDSIIPKSQYYEGQAEGIVFKSYKKQIFAKLVAKKFKEKNEEVFGMTKKKARSVNDNELFVATYCTNSRIDKGIFKLIEEGNSLSLELMHKLPVLILNDIWEENWKEIIKSNLTLNFMHLKKAISKRCLVVLKNIIEINTISKKGF